MPEPDLIQLFAQPLGQIGVRYLVSGSVASMLYGEPRVTHDIDFVVFLRAEQRGHFNVIHADSGLKADFYIAHHDELHAWAFRHSKRYSIGETPISLAPPEYVILRKLEYYREGGSEKHLRDIRSMLAVSGEQIDHAALNDWIQRRGLQPEWAAV